MAIPTECERGDMDVGLNCDAQQPVTGGDRLDICRPVDMGVRCSWSQLNDEKDLAEFRV